MDSVAYIAEAITSATGPVIPAGAATKPALAACAPSTTRIDMRGLSGIVGYEPSEYLISARAGTAISQLQSALSEHGQYLPFDPMFVDQGATLGGTVASGLSGSGHMLYGSLRDFVMEVELVDGLGKMVRGGGKVVKNAAGFDLPKLLVGSYGRLGVLTEITLKVFPRPQAFATLIAHWPSIAECIQATQSLMSQPLPLTACDIEPSPSGEIQLSARFAAPSNSLPNVLRRGTASLNRTTEAIIEPDQERQLWLARARQNERIDHSQATFLVRIATSLDRLPSLFGNLTVLTDACPRSTGGGSCTWLSLKSMAEVGSLDLWLSAHSLSGVVVNGTVQSLVALGQKSWLKTAQKIQQAIDPQRKFSSF